MPPFLVLRTAPTAWHSALPPNGGGASFSLPPRSGACPSEKQLGMVPGDTCSPVSKMSLGQLMSPQEQLKG